MNPLITLTILAGFLLLALSAAASDACSRRSVSAHADVTVSDGEHYQVITYYHAPNAAAARFVSDTVRTVTAEGPYAWNSVQTAEGTEEALGQQAHKVFALGHQFHALYLHFNDIMTGIGHDSAAIPFQNGIRAGLRGDYPYGGHAWIIDAGADEHPLGMRFVFPGTGPIEAVFEDWREAGGRDVPYRITIHHEGQQFQYDFRSIDLNDKSPLWFMDAVAAPDLDEIKVYRLHRKLLAAHCIGDGEMMGRLTAPEILVASQGALIEDTARATGERFTSYFKTVRYTEYTDLKEPVIEIAKSEDLGWVGVNVRTRGERIPDGPAFTDEWAWIMLVKKIGGKWLNAGNASNVKGEAP